MNIATTLMLVFALATIVEALVTHILVQLPSAWKPYAALVAAVGLCVTYKVDLVAQLLSVEASTPLVGYVLTGLLISRGSNVLNDIISRIRNPTVPARVFVDNTSSAPAQLLEAESIFPPIPTLEQIAQVVQRAVSDSPRAHNVFNTPIPVEKVAGTPTGTIMIGGRPAHDLVQREPLCSSKTEADEELEEAVAGLGSQDLRDSLSWAFTTGPIDAVGVAEKMAEIHKEHNDAAR